MITFKIPFIPVTVQILIKPLVITGSAGRWLQITKMQGYVYSSFGRSHSFLESMSKRGLLSSAPSPSGRVVEWNITRRGRLALWCIEKGITNYV